MPTSSRIYKPTKNSARPQTGAVWRGTLLFFRHQALCAAHIRLQGLGHQYAAVCLQVVLQEGDEHSGGRHHRVVQGVGQVVAVLALNADLQTAGLGLDFA